MSTTAKANTGTKVLTVEDINAAYGDDNWGGYGYLGERKNHYFTKMAKANLGDQLLLEDLNERGLSKTELFYFCDSRIGRHYGDLVFGGFDDEEICEQSNAFFTEFHHNITTIAASY